MIKFEYFFSYKTLEEKALTPVVRSPINQVLTLVCTMEARITSS
jgi:hypothetical protein